MSTAAATRFPCPCIASRTVRCTKHTKEALVVNTLTASVAAAYLRVGDTIEFGGAEGRVVFVSTTRPMDAENAGQLMVDVVFGEDTTVTPLWLPATWQVTLTENPIQ